MQGARPVVVYLLAAPAPSGCMRRTSPVAVAARRDPVTVTPIGPGDTMLVGKRWF